MTFIEALTVCHSRFPRAKNASPPLWLVTPVDKRPVSGVLWETNGPMGGCALQRLPGLKYPCWERGKLTNLNRHFMARPRVGKIPPADHLSQKFQAGFSGKSRWWNFREANPVKQNWQNPARWPFIPEIPAGIFGMTTLQDPLGFVTIWNVAQDQGMSCSSCK